MGSSATYGSDQVIIRSIRLIQIFVLGFIFLFIPTQSFATSGIARNVAAACAPNPTMPDVGSCSACHSTTNNRGPNDLTAAGQWSTSASTFNLFCPATTTPPNPTPTPPTPTPTPPPGSPATPTPSPTPGMGGSGARSSDDDDDDHDDDDDEEMDDDDDGGSASSFRSRLRALRSRLRSFGRD